MCASKRTVGSNPTTSALEEIQESCVHGVTETQEPPKLLDPGSNPGGRAKDSRSFLSIEYLEWKRVRAAEGTRLESE